LSSQNFSFLFQLDPFLITTNDSSEGGHVRSLDFVAEMVYIHVLRDRKLSASYCFEKARLATAIQTKQTIAPGME
jgi:hypothetical protein